MRLIWGIGKFQTKLADLKLVDLKVTECQSRAQPQQHDEKGAKIKCNPAKACPKWSNRRGKSMLDHISNRPTPNIGSSWTFCRVGRSAEIWQLSS